MQELYESEPRQGTRQQQEPIQGMRLVARPFSPANILILFVWFFVIFLIGFLIYDSRELEKREALVHELYRQSFRSEMEAKGIRLKGKNQH